MNIGWLVHNGAMLVHPTSVTPLSPTDHSLPQMGCGDYDSAAACFQGLGAEAATAAFVSHWSSWYAADDLTKMASYGLDAARVPVGCALRFLSSDISFVTNLVIC